ncbi:MAG: hypothetical protein M1826_005662, partial [Phylliscum demangeonii]
MSTATGSTAGLMDPEKELTCSICTEILYQPLTLIDCLHTFCGSCLKEWFACQAKHPTQTHPFTCPACRASVLGTKPNAMVTSLLDIYLLANPSRGKTGEEKAELALRYRPGDVVMPSLASRRAPARPRDDDDEEEPDTTEDGAARRAEARERNLRFVHPGWAQAVEGYERSRRRAAHQGRAEPRGLEERRDERRAEVVRQVLYRGGGDDAREPRLWHPVAAGRRAESNGDRERERERERRHPPAAATAGVTRAIEHQSSLRSLLSASDLESSDVEEEIARAIMDEIDLSSLDTASEDTVSERIAEAYQRYRRDRVLQLERTRRDD